MTIYRISLREGNLPRNNRWRTHWLDEAGAARERAVPRRFGYIELIDCRGAMPDDRQSWPHLRA